jgi:hypothetical protein
MLTKVPMLNKKSMKQGQVTDRVNDPFKNAAQFCHASRRFCISVKQTQCDSSVSGVAWA